jgi:hypothetical protein
MRNKKRYHLSEGVYLPAREVPWPPPPPPAPSGPASLALVGAVRRPPALLAASAAAAIPPAAEARFDSLGDGLGPLQPGIVLFRLALLLVAWTGGLFRIVMTFYRKWLGF